MTPAAYANSLGVTINQMAKAWGISRRGLEKMFHSYPHRFELIALGVKTRLTPNK